MFGNYIKIAIRHLSRSKLFSTINILGLAIGIAACLLILLFIQNELSFEKMHPDVSRIYRVLTIDKALGTHAQRVGITIPALGPSLAANFPEIEATSRVAFGRRTLLKRGDNNGIYAEQMRSAEANFFDFFNFNLIEGDKTTALKEPFSIILSEKLAGQLFGGENALGETIQDGNGASLKVTGILQNLPENTHFEFDALQSMETEASQARANRPPNATRPIWLESWQMIAMPTYLKLKEGISPAGLDAKFTKHCREHDVEENFDITLQALSDVHLHSTDIIFDPVANKGDMKNVYIFAAIACLILLIAMVNYMNLSTARSTQRAREVGLRKVVGSLRAQLILQFMGESILLTLISVLLALPLASLALPALNRILGTHLLLNTIGGLLIPLFLLGILIVVGVVAGLYPAFVLSRFKPVTVLKGNYSTGKSGVWLRKSLVVFQFTLSIALICLTVVVHQQMKFIQSKDLGYDRERVVLFNMNDQRMGLQLETLRKELAKSPAFISLGASSNVPGRTFGRTSVRPEGASEEDIWIWSQLSASPETFPTLGMQMVNGRNFSREMGGDTSGVCIINQEAVRQLGWEDPLAKRIYLGENDSVGVQVLGVVKDFHFIGMHQPIEPVIIFPLNRFPGYVLAGRIQKGSTAEALSFAGEKWAEIYPDRPFAYIFMDDEFNDLYKRDINTSYIINVFSILAIFIACLGLFSLASHSTAVRTREIGVRKVLGASTGLIIRLLIFDFVRWVILANLFAWPLAWLVANKWLEGFAYRVTVDPIPFVLAGLVAILSRWRRYWDNHGARL